MPILGLADCYMGPCLKRVRSPQVAPKIVSGHVYGRIVLHHITGRFHSLVWLHTQATRAHLGGDGEPVAAADVRVDLEAHVVRHVVLPHIHQRIQSILHQEYLLTDLHLPG